MTAFLHSSHITDAVRRLDKGETMKSIKARLAAYDLPPTEEITEAFCLSHEETRKAGYRDQLQVLLLCLVDFESNPEPVPDVTPEKRAEHLEHAEHLRGIFRSHGIDPRDFDACMDYIIGNGNIVPRYWAKIYVDYIHGDDLDATRPTATVPDASPLVVTSGQAKWLRDQGYSGDLSVIDHFPPFADEALIIPSHSVPPVGFFQCMGRAMRADFRSFTDQEARAAFNYQDKCKFNKFPRGKCAKRMLTLGWHFNED